MKWFVDEKEKLENSKKGQELLLQHKDLFDGYEALLNKTDDRYVKSYSQEELNEDVMKMVTIVNGLDKKAITLENGESINLRSVFQRMTRYLKSRIDRKWEEVILERLKEIREQRGMSQAELAEQSGLSPSYINRIESGERHNISLDKLKSMCSALNYPMESLVREDFPVGRIGVLEDLIFDNDFTLNGNLVDAKRKYAIINLIKSMSDLDWSEPDLSKKMGVLVKIAEEFHR